MKVACALKARSIYQLLTVNFDDENTDIHDAT